MCLHKLVGLGWDQSYSDDSRQSITEVDLLHCLPILCYLAWHTWHQLLGQNLNNRRVAVRDNTISSHDRFTSDQVEIKNGSLHDQVSTLIMPAQQFQALETSRTS